MPKSTDSRTSRKATKPNKPYPDFPLFAHASGKWCKVIKGRMYYFGRWDNPQAALDEYLEVRDDLHAGRTPSKDRDGLTMRDLCNRFIHSKRLKHDAGKLTAATFIDYDRICKLLLDQFGRTRHVAELRPTDFEQLYGKLAHKAVSSLSSKITMCRSVFKYAYDMDLIDRPVKFGPTFKVPSKAEKRKAKAKAKQQHGKKMFESDEIKMMLDAAPLQLRAMILLGINGGCGNTDCATLPMQALDLDNGWLDFARSKTGIDRRIPLWPETVETLREVIATRKEPHNDDDVDLVFVTKYGQRWVRCEIEDIKGRFGKKEVKIKADDAIAKATAKLLRELGLKRHGVGFYALRHSFETIAGGSRDQVAVDAIMGHVDPTMAAEYREGIDDNRLRDVVNHVHCWLFDGGQDDE